MTIYSRYIVARVVGPFLLITFSLTGIVWLAQSLKFIDFIVNRGLNATMFLYLSSLLIPSLLMIVLPVSLFISVLIAYNKLTTESELLVMRSAGMSKIDILKPAIIVALWVTVFSYTVSLFLLPTSYREFKDLQSFIRDNYVSVLLQEGVFNNPTKNLTVYIRQITSGGELHGMLMHDNRIKSKPITMMAESGKLIKTPQGPRFILINGNRQEIDQNSQELSLLYFDRYALDLSTFSQPNTKRWREPEERYLSELFTPQESLAPALELKLLVEGHHRLVWPLYNLMLTLLAMIAFLGGELNRRGQWKRIVIVSTISIASIGIAITLKNTAAKYEDLIMGMYGFVALSTLVCGYMVLHNHRGRVPFAPRHSESQETGL